MLLCDLDWREIYANAIKEGVAVADLDAMSIPRLHVLFCQDSKGRTIISKDQAIALARARKGTANAVANSTR